MCRWRERGGSRPEIVLTALTKRYGDVCAVDDVNLEIRRGEFFSLLGPSGCGKTTTLRMIGGFEEPTSGTIVVAGQDVTRDPPERRPVNMVFQSYALFPHLNVFDNVAFGLRRRHVPARRCARGSERSSRSSACRATTGAGPTSSRAASSSGSRSPARW